MAESRPEDDRNSSVTRVKCNTINYYALDVIGDVCISSAESSEQFGKDIKAVRKLNGRHLVLNFELPGVRFDSSGLATLLHFADKNQGIPVDICGGNEDGRRIFNTLDREKYSQFRFYDKFDDFLKSYSDKLRIFA